jgi:hypothetical protein
MLPLGGKVERGEQGTRDRDRRGDRFSQATVAGYSLASPAGCRRGSPGLRPRRSARRTWRGTVSAMTRPSTLERAHVWALLLAAMVAACSGGSKPPATGPDHGVGAGARGAADTRARAQASGEGAVLPLWPEVKRGTLPNGLTYYILKHQKPEHRAFLWLAVNAGAVLEDDDQRGLAHFDEHMAFNGTKRFPKAEIVNYLEKNRHGPKALTQVSFRSLRVAASGCRPESIMSGHHPDTPGNMIPHCNGRCRGCSLSV